VRFYDRRFARITDAELGILLRIPPAPPPPIENGLSHNLFCTKKPSFQVLLSRHIILFIYALRSVARPEIFLVWRKNGRPIEGGSLLLALH